MARLQTTAQKWGPGTLRSDVLRPVFLLSFFLARFQGDRLSFVAQGPLDAIMRCLKGGRAGQQQAALDALTTVRAGFYRAVAHSKYKTNEDCTHEINYSEGRQYRRCEGSISQCGYDRGRALNKCCAECNLSIWIYDAA